MLQEVASTQEQHYRKASELKLLNPNKLILFRQSSLLYRGHMRYKMQWIYTETKARGQGSIELEKKTRKKEE